MGYEICLFDLDGMLTEPKLGITKSYQYALSAFGIHEELDNLTKFIGPPLREVFCKHYGFSSENAEKAVEKYREYFSKTGLFENVVYPAIPQTLKKLREHSKILAVATSKTTIYTTRILAHFNLNDYFSFVSGDEMDGSLTKNGKRDIIRIALDAIDPERKKSTVMIGDRKHDIIGAKENRIDSIGNTWGYGSRNELDSVGATWIVDSADELCCLIMEENVL